VLLSVIVKAKQNCSPPLSLDAFSRSDDSPTNQAAKDCGKHHSYSYTLNDRRTDAAHKASHVGDGDDDERARAAAPKEMERAIKSDGGKGQESQNICSTP